jgi:uncharacterized membrane protein
VAETLAESLRSYLSPQLVVFIISLLPVLELRGSLIVASLFQIPWWEASLIAIAGNMLAVPLVILLTERALEAMSRQRRFRFLHRAAAAIERKGRGAGRRLQRRFPNKLRLGLLLFVAIPLPGTGAWTGGIAAALMGLKPRYAAPPICLGILCACVAMLVLAYLLPSLFSL